MRQEQASDQPGNSAALASSTPGHPSVHTPVTETDLSSQRQDVPNVQGLY